MTKPLPLLLLLAGCPSSDGNPHVLWLAPDQAETRVKLVAAEPHPY
jgi:hypothetical protein